jgi:hypothetical protein
MVQDPAMALHHLIYIIVNLSNKRCLKKSNQIKSNQSLVMETQNMMVAADNLY